MAESFLKYFFELFCNFVQIFAFQFGYNCVYVYSRCQLLCIKANNHVSKIANYIKTRCYYYNGKNGNNYCEDNCTVHIELFNKRKQQKYDYYCNPRTDDVTLIAQDINEIKQRMNLGDFHVCNLNNDSGALDKAIRDKTSSDKTSRDKTSKMIFQDFNNVVWKNNKIVCNQSTNRFISMQVMFANCDNNNSGETTHKIQLITNSYNFYIVGNKINIDFIEYYFTHVVRIERLPTALKYLLTIVDDDVNVVTLTEEEELVFMDDNKYVCKKY